MRKTRFLEDFFFIKLACVLGKFYPNDLFKNNFYRLNLKARLDLNKVHKVKKVLHDYLCFIYWCF
jgi:hypothetical protein